VADTFRNLDEETRERLRALPSNDQVFADAIRASRVVLGESGLPRHLGPDGCQAYLVRAGCA
jgi:adenylate cyclase